MRINSIQSKNYFNISKCNNKNITDKIKPVNYSIQNIIEGMTGLNIKNCIIDSGEPQHKDIKVRNNMKVEGENVSFCDENSCVYDKYGHSTMISGIIKGRNKNSIIGVAPSSKLLYAKVVNDKGQCSFNSVVAAVLWAIVKNVDIITIALGTDYDYSVLHDAIRKARKNNICIIAASGKKNTVQFPSEYNEVFSVDSFKDKKNDIVGRNGFYTTYLDNKYIKITGNSMLTAYYSGIAALLIEKYKKTIPKHEIVPLVYYNLKAI